MSVLSDWSGQVFVLKVGGAPIRERHTLDALLTDVQVLQRAGARVVLMHGGGPQATQLTESLGLKPNILGGRRITNAAVLEVMKMTLAGSVSVDILARCRALGIPAVGAPGVAADAAVRRLRRPGTAACHDRSVAGGSAAAGGGGGGRLGG